MLAKGDADKNVSGRQEMLENLLNRYIELGMTPVRVKLYGLIPMTRRRYLAQLVVALVLSAGLLVGVVAVLADRARLARRRRAPTCWTASSGSGISPRSSSGASSCCR